MFHIDTAAVTVLFVAVLLATLAGLVTVGIFLGHEYMSRRPARLVRRQTASPSFAGLAASH